MTGNKIILYIATIISILTYMFWEFLPKGSWYIGNSFFIFLICCYVYFNNKKSFICFSLFTLSLSNLFDELLFDPKELAINEIIIGLILIIKLVYDVQRKRFHY